MNQSGLELERAPVAVAARSKPAGHQRGLVAIGLFKLLNSLLYVCIGFGALRLVHKDLGEELLKLALLLHRDPEGKLVQFLLEKVDLIDAHRLREIGAFTFIYACLHFAEGLGLMLEKVWAEYLTLVITGGFLPWELYEMVMRPGWFRFGLLAINLAVLAYLAFVLAKKRAAEPRKA